jgi:hypothetical protein
MSTLRDEETWGINAEFFESVQSEGAKKVGG